jgi:hypothetical protein
LQEQKTKSLEIAFTTFIQEFMKIERQIGNLFYCLYILKGIVDTARQVRADYTREETRNSAIKFFKESVYARIDSIAKWCQPKELNFEKMLCALFCLTRAIEGVLYKEMNIVIDKQNKYYQRLRLKTPLELAIAVEVNIPAWQTYQFSSKTSVLVVNSLEEKCDMISLSSSQCQELNSIDSVSWGPVIYNFLNREKEEKESGNEPEESENELEEKESGNELEESGNELEEKESGNELEESGNELEETENELEESEDMNSQELSFAEDEPYSHSASYQDEQTQTDNSEDL